MRLLSAANKARRLLKPTGFSYESHLFKPRLASSDALKEEAQMVHSAVANLKLAGAIDKCKQIPPRPATVDEVKVRLECLL